MHATNPKLGYVVLPFSAFDAERSNESGPVIKSIYDDQYRAIIGALREARLAAGLRQADVAEVLGKPQSYLAKVEGCERRLDLLEYLALCRAIGVDPKSLF